MTIFLSDITFLLILNLFLKVSRAFCSKCKKVGRIKKYRVVFLYLTFGTYQLRTSSKLIKINLQVFLLLEYHDKEGFNTFLMLYVFHSALSRVLFDSFIARPECSILGKLSSFSYLFSSKFLIVFLLPQVDNEISVFLAMARIILRKMKKHVPLAPPVFLYTIIISDSYLICEFHFVCLIQNTSSQCFGTTKKKIICFLIMSSRVIMNTGRSACPCLTIEFKAIE